MVSRPLSYPFALGHQYPRRLFFVLFGAGLFNVFRTLAVAFPDRSLTNPPSAKSDIFSRFFFEPLLILCVPSSVGVDA